MMGRGGWLGTFAAGLLLSGLGVLLGPAQAQARPAEPAAGHAAPEVRTGRAGGEILLDGRLTEDAWAAAEPVREFIQLDPEEGAPVSQPTEVRILYDEQALYVGARLQDTRPVSTRLGRRDAYLSDSDWFSVTLDSYHDHRTAYRFRVNPSGVRSDEVLAGGGGDFGDDSWDPVWQVETAVTDSGWVVEMRIPFNQLRFRPADQQTWGIQIEREIARRQEEAVFAFTPKRERGGIARFGHLTGLRDIRPSGRWEILPYLVGRAQYEEAEIDPDAGFDNPFQDGSEYGTRLGMDVKYRVTSNLTLDATLNPDFGQVEADPAEVNLSAFETRFDERRPFFVEGSDVFRFGGRGAQFFYSRRIGRSPQVDDVDGAVYRDVPDASTILGAAKLTGKTSGWSIGVLEAVTGRETAPYVDATGELRRAEVEPLSNYFVGRARREMREGRTLVGGIVTAAHRDLSDDRVRGALRSAAYVGGLDFQHEWADRTWAVSGWAVGSHVRGEPGVLLDAQRSPARYYQRPDALYLSLDSSATSLSGYLVGVELEKEAGTHWLGDLNLAAISPGFEINDLGFFREADRLEANASVEYVENRPGRLLRDWRIRVDPSIGWNYGGDRLGTRIGAEASGELLNYWSGELRVSHGFGGLDDRLTRGGPLTRALVEDEVSVELESDRRKSLSGSMRAGYRQDELGGWRRWIEVGLDLRPAPNWTLSARPQLSQSRTEAQYLASVADPLATATYGRRYLFSDLDRTTVSLQARLNVIFTPELTLEVYAEPFLASGGFGTPKQLARPRSLDFEVFGEDVGTLERLSDDEFLVDPDGQGPAAAFRIDDEDFRRGSLRGNAVLRWEWRPGSTLFLVWQQERSSFQSVDRFRLGPGFADLWAEQPRNVLLLKVSYWLSR